MTDPQKKDESRVLMELKEYIGVMIVVPILVLSGFGVVSLFLHGYSLYFAGALLLCTVAILAPRLWRSLTRSEQRPKEAQQESDAPWVTPSGEWSSHDSAAWEALNDKVQQQLAQNSEWESLYGYALEIVNDTAQKYDRKSLSFSLPELLMLTEEVSRRYRKVLLTHVPGIEKMPVSLIRFGYEHRTRLPLLVKTATVASNIIRAVRITNPLTFLMAESKNMIFSEAFGTLSDRLQHKLKLAFLQDVIAVSIEMYSGRFKIDKHELTESEIKKDDDSHQSIAIEPLRICVLGQVSAGKSSIINALTKNISAEVHALPSTNQKTVYQFRLEEMEVLHLIDLPGMDGTEENKNFLLKEISLADMVIWVLKANQSARMLDSEFKKLFDAFYKKRENRSRKIPTIIGILNQVDRLNPVSEWMPPYDIENGQNKKENTIREAIHYNKNLLALETLIPLSVSEDKEHFNITDLEKTIGHFCTEGIQTQLNRRRFRSTGGVDLTDSIKRLGKSIKFLFSSH